MTIDRTKIEAQIVKGCPLPLTFHWDEHEDGNALLQIAMPVETPSGRPVVIIAFPVNMPAPFMPKVIARAKAVIEDIFNANMVGIVFTGQPQSQLVKPQKSLLLPGSLVGGNA